MVRRDILPRSVFVLGLCVKDVQQHARPAVEEKTIDNGERSIVRVRE